MGDFHSIQQAVLLPIHSAIARQRLIVNCDVYVSKFVYICLCVYLLDYHAIINTSHSR